MAIAGEAHREPARGRLAQLVLGALGIVFGDIGTSPLYTLHECVHFDGAAMVQPADVLGVLSLVFWALTMVVTVKYLTFIMRADNHGEGGIFALLALIPPRMRTARSGGIGWAAVLVVVGAALLYGDGMITPAISVLSAMEGLEVAAPALKPVVLPMTCLVLVGLFAIQSRGTGRVGALFGPVMLVWFVTIGCLGVLQIVRHPGVLAALDPMLRGGVLREAWRRAERSSSAPSSSPSRAAKRSTPTWATSARARSASRGSAS